MTSIQTAQDVLDEVNILETGRWYIAELEEPQLAVQGESEQDARQKMVKRWKEYTEKSAEDGRRTRSDVGTEPVVVDRESLRL